MRWSAINGVSSQVAGVQEEYSTVGYGCVRYGMTRECTVL